VGKILPIVDLLHISRTAEATDFKLCVRIEGWGPIENYAKVGHSGWGHVTCFEILVPFVSPEGLKLKSPSMKPLPSYFGLLSYCMCDNRR